MLLQEYMCELTQCLLVLRKKADCVVEHKLHQLTFEAIHLREHSYIRTPNLAAAPELDQPGDFLGSPLAKLLVG